MTVQRRIASPAIDAILAIALVFLASSCSQSTSSAKLPAPSAVASPTPSPSPPPGGPVPAQLLGNWFLGPVSYVAVNGYAAPCPSPPTGSNCFFKLTFTATTFRQSFTAVGGTQSAGHGNVVVNKSEIDFFNGDCDGVGRYTWTLTTGVLRFVLISDNCPRYALYTYTGWTRTA
jgi:hypothetical protein